MSNFDVFLRNYLLHALNAGDLKFALLYQIFLDYEYRLDIYFINCLRLSPFRPTVSLSTLRRARYRTPRKTRFAAAG